MSKTVGTPAFYAPELCYSGDDYVDANGRGPKITGAIDIWSLGVTLYGMIFGRLPFVSDDEYSLFQSIGKNDLFIPKKRLKPVEVDSSKISADPRHGVMNSNKRLEDEFVYEDIDPMLDDLLRRLLNKDPQNRITIKGIKTHEWVLQDLKEDPADWVQKTDPQSKGNRIEVSKEEVTSAVSKVPFVDLSSHWPSGLTLAGKVEATLNGHQVRLDLPSILLHLLETLVVHQVVAELAYGGTGYFTSIQSCAGGAPTFSKRHC